MNSNKEIESSFYKRFNEQKPKYITSKKSYSIKLIRPITRYAPYDFTIKIGSSTIAVIELKRSNLIDVFDYSSIENYASTNNIRYVIISDGERFIVSDRKNPNYRETVNFAEFIRLLIQTDDIDSDKLRIEIASLIKSILIESQLKIDQIKLMDIFTHLPTGIEYNEIEQSFSFRNPSDINNIENRIFRMLLDDDIPLKKVYRYTSLDTIFSMLNYNSFRMNCLVGMNDTTEVNYADNYLTGTNKDYTQAIYQTVEGYNKRFISSCTLKRDDLTQWRLYADNSKGVCLIFNVDSLNLNSKYILKRISYADSNGVHPKLEIIKRIIAKLKEDLDVDFEFKTLSTWRHFFKPQDYSVEKEVRLLFVNNDEDVKKGWVLTHSHNILNPYIEFKLNDIELPIQLTEIMLGPNCAEKGINKKQFEQFIRELRRKKITVTEDDVEKQIDEYNIRNLEVSLSNINNYR